MRKFEKFIVNLYAIKMPHASLYTYSNVLKINTFQNLDHNCLKTKYIFAQAGIKVL